MRKRFKKRTKTSHPGYYTDIGDMGPISPPLIETPEPRIWPWLVGSVVALALLGFALSLSGCAVHRDGVRELNVRMSSLEIRTGQSFKAVAEDTNGLTLWLQGVENRVAQLETKVAVLEGKKEARGVEHEIRGGLIHVK